MAGAWWIRFNESVLTPTDPTTSIPVARRDLLRLAALAVVVGMLAGGLGTGFRLLVSATERGRVKWIEAGWSSPWVSGPVVVLVLALAAAAAAWLVRRFAPLAAGSGIPQVEATVAGELPLPPNRILPVKVLGGWLALGSGLALGREGPSIQMGAGAGAWLGRRFRLSHHDCVALVAAGGGAGLAAAFNAPIAGAVFVLEELVRRFDPRIALAALGASGGAMAVARILVGEAPDFTVPSIPYPGYGSAFLFLPLGLLAGAFGVVYNRMLLSSLAWIDRHPRVPVELRAGVIGAVLGIAGWFLPYWMGGGEILTQRALTGHLAWSWLPLMLGFRFLASVASYSAGTPGGLFAPLLVLGAQLGLMFAHTLHGVIAPFGIPPIAFALVGMAALFAAVVRAPATGLVLVTELTGNVTLLLPMLAACFAAMLIPAWLGEEPIYDSLRQRLLRRAEGQVPAASPVPRSESPDSTESPGR